MTDLQPAVRCSGKQSLSVAVLATGHEMVRSDEGVLLIKKQCDLHDLFRINRNIAPVVSTKRNA